ncbi:MAG: biopolymer transport protein ExbD [Cryomorphaceae bacterium]|jgi:biopolymer transport protein ExbD
MKRCLWVLVFAGVLGGVYWFCLREGDRPAKQAENVVKIAPAVPDADTDTDTDGNTDGNTDTDKPERENFLKELVMATIKTREQDLLMTLPAKLPKSKGAAVEKTFLIAIEANEELRVNSENKVLSDIELSEKLMKYSAYCAANKASPVVQLFISPDVPQKRVMDLLNLLKGADIDNVTFSQTKPE